MKNSHALGISTHLTSRSRLIARGIYPTLMRKDGRRYWSVLKDGKKLLCWPFWAFVGNHGRHLQGIHQFASGWLAAVKGSVDRKW